MNLWKRLGMPSIGEGGVPSHKSFWKQLWVQVNPVVYIGAGVWTALFLANVTKTLPLHDDLMEIISELRELKVEIVRLQGKTARGSALEAAVQLAKVLPRNMTTKAGMITADARQMILLVRDEGQTWTYSLTGSTVARFFNSQNPEAAKTVDLESLKSGSWGVVIHERGSQNATEIYQLPETQSPSPSLP